MVIDALEIKAPTNSTFTDSSISIYVLPTIQLFAKQITLLNGFPGSSATADHSGEQMRLFVKISSFGCLHAGLSLSLRGSSAGVSFELACLRPHMAMLLHVRGLGMGQSVHGVDHEPAAWDAPPQNVWLSFSSSSSKFMNE